MLDARNVLVGTADQSVTGAILSAPLGTPLPTKANAEINEAFKGSGYVSNDGLTFTIDDSTQDINEWNGALVRRVLESRNVTLSWSHLETNVESLRNTFGEENVSVTDATDTEGQHISVKIGATLPAPREWIFKLKDGDNRILIVVPDGQITNVDEVSFTATDAITWPVTLSTYADKTNHNVYIYFYDGQTLKDASDAAESSVNDAANSAKALRDQA